MLHTHQVRVRVYQFLHLANKRGDIIARLPLRFYKRLDFNTQGGPGSIAA